MNRWHKSVLLAGLFFFALSSNGNAQGTLLLVDVGCQDIEPGWVQLDTCGLFEDLDGSGIDVTLETGNPEACACRTPGATQDELPGVQGDLLFADNEVGPPGADFIIRLGGLSPGTSYLVTSYHHRSDEGETVIQGVEVLGADDVDAPSEIVHSAESFLEPAEIQFKAAGTEVEIRYIAPDPELGLPREAILNGFILDQLGNTCPDDPDLPDTHCSELVVAGPADGGPGTYTATATALDDSGGPIVYKFTATGGPGGPIQEDGIEPTADFFLAPGAWTIAVEVGDRCPSNAPDFRCEVPQAVVCPAAGDSHCGSLDVEAPAGGGPGTFVFTVNGSDDGGDILSYALSAQRGADDPIQLAQDGDNVFSVRLGPGSWTVRTTVDDTDLCEDSAADDTCEVAVEVSAPVGREELIIADIGTEPARTANGFASLVSTSGDSPQVFEDFDFTGIDITIESGVENDLGFRSRAGGTDLSGDYVHNDNNGGGLDMEDEEQLEEGRISLTFTNLDAGAYELRSFHHNSDDGPDSIIDPLFIFITGAVSSREEAEDVIQTAGPDTADEDIGEGLVSFTATGDGPVSVDFVPSGENADPPGGRHLASRTFLNGFILSLVAGPSEGSAFERGNADGTGSTELTDGVFVLNFLFLGGTAPPCDDAADVDDNGALELTDGVFLLNFLFLGGSTPPAPTASCGVDPTPDDLTCASFSVCP